MGKEKDHVIRQLLWVIVAVSSAVALTAVVMQIKTDNLKHTPAINFIISAAAITMCIAALFASAIACKIGFVLKAEMPSAVVNLLLWVAAIAVLCHRTDLATRTTVTNGIASVYVSNANIYYFSWASVIFSLVLFNKTLTDFGMIWQDKFSRRFAQWGFLVLTSIVSVSSSVGWLRSASCNSSWTAPCAAARYTLSWGIVVCVLSLLTMIASFLLKESKKIIFVVEVGVSVLSVVLYAIGVARVTAPDAPGSAIGNLYYFTWFSFLVSVLLFIDCIMEKLHPSSTSETESPEEVPDEEKQIETSSESAKMTEMPVETAPEAAMPEIQGAYVCEIKS